MCSRQVRWSLFAVVRLVVGTFLLASTRLPCLAEEVRTWTDVTGKHKTEAEFVSADDKAVVLRKPGTAKTLTMPLSRLSEADREYVQQRLSDSPPEAELKEGAEAKKDEEAESVPSPARKSGNRPVSNNVVNSVRGAALRNETRANARQIAIALINHEAANGRFPLSAAYTTADGKPGLSWRVAILPMLEENNLYSQFNLQEPWDSAHNKALIAQMPKIFESPGAKLEAGYTNYLSVVGPNTIISNGRRGTRATDVADGTSRTVMFVEADDTHAVIWTKPDDYNWDQQNPVAGLGHIWSGQFFAVFGDGSVHFLSSGLPTETINGLFSRNGGEPIQLDE